MSPPPQHRENPWLNLGINVLLPALVLMKGKDLLDGQWQGTADDLNMLVFVLAMSLPLLYGGWDLVVRRKWNFFSILGFVGVALTGGIGILKLPPEWVAIKEAAIPGIIGLVVIGSHFVNRPLVRLFLLRPEFVNVDVIKQSLDDNDANGDFEQVVRKSNLLFAGSFALSTVLNYGLARYVVVSPAGTEAFNEELGRMALLSYPVIVLPTMVVTAFALWLLLSSLERLTGRPLEQLMIDGKAKEQDAGRSDKDG